MSSFSEAYGKCAEITLEIAEKDPSLTRVRGHYICPIWGKRGHWWLKKEDGTIVDPTKAQFPSGGFGEYIEWVEGAEEPTGICMNCGEEVYGSDYFCSKRCEALVRADFV